MLTDHDRAEIARRQARERPHRIAAHLNLPKRVVKAEIRRLHARGSARAGQGPRRRVRLAAVAGVLVALLGAGAGVAHGVRAQGVEEQTTPSLTEDAPKVEILEEAPEAKALYERVSRGETPELDELRRKLVDADETVRLAAVRAFARRPPSDSDPDALLPRLNDAVSRIRLSAIQALGSIASPTSVPALAAVSTAKRPLHERLLAVDALGRIPAEEALSALCQRLSDPAPTIRRRAFGHLARQLGDQGCTVEQLEAEPDRVHATFTRHLQERRR